MTACAQATALSPLAPARGRGAPARALILCGDGFSAGRADDFRRAYPDHELWTMNAQRCPDATRHFDIHYHRQPANLAARAHAHDHGAQVIVSPFVAAAAGAGEVCFPLLDIFLRFGTALYQRTLCFMLALACWERVSGRRAFDLVCLPGHDFSTWPHFSMRDGPHLWIGVARGGGLAVLPAPGSSLGRRVLEPWRRPPPADWLHDLRADEPHMYGQPRAVTAPHAAFYGWE